MAKTRPDRDGLPLASRAHLLTPTSLDNPASSNFTSSHYVMSSSMFNNNNHVDISGGDFTNVEYTVSNYTNQTGQKEDFERLRPSHKADY